MGEISPGSTLSFVSAYFTVHAYQALRDALLRLTADSPDLLAVIKSEGKGMNRSSRHRFLRANGPAPNQPRATPWVTRRDKHLSPEGASQPPRPNLARPFRAQWQRNPKPRALPWAGMGRTVGAEESQRATLTHLHQTLNAPSHPVRNRLLRLTADSPDLLAIIKQEGKV
jgi:hypothetical protein